QAVTVRTSGGGSAVEGGVGSDADGWFAAVSADADVGPDALDALLAGLVTDTLSCAQAVLRPDGRLGFVAVRLTALDAPGVSVPELAVGLGAQRAARALLELGHAGQVLDPDALLAALLDVNGLDGPPQEHWSYWRSGGLSHTFFRTPAV